MPYPVSAVRSKGSNPSVSSLLTGLSSFWSMDEVSNGSAPVTRNDSADSNPLSDIGNCASIAGVNGNAVVTTTAPKYLRCNSATNLQTGDIEFTVAARVWVTTGGSAFVIACKGTAADLSTIEFGLTGNIDFSFDIWQSSAPQSLHCTNFGNFSTGQWYDVIAWVDKSGTPSLNIEVNGVVTSVAKTKTPVAGAAQFAVGAYANGVAPFPGRVDDLTFWQRKLTASERATWRTTTYPF